jgi:cold shock protein
MTDDLLLYVKEHEPELAAMNDSGCMFLLAIIRDAKTPFFSVREISEQTGLPGAYIDPRLDLLRRASFLSFPNRSVKTFSLSQNGEFTLRVIGMQSHLATLHEMKSSFTRFLEMKPSSTKAGSGLETGTVRWWNEDRGCGFLARADGPPDVFVLSSAIKEAGIKSLKEGDHVQFRVEKTERGLIAKDVTRLKQRFDAG